MMPSFRRPPSLPSWLVVLAFVATTAATLTVSAAQPPTHTQSETSQTEIPQTETLQTGDPAPRQAPAPERQVATYEIQGSSHYSPLAGQWVRVMGVVTAVEPGEGFFLQDPVGDGDLSTSDGLFVQAEDLIPLDHPTPSEGAGQDRAIETVLVPVAGGREAKKATTLQEGARGANPGGDLAAAPTAHSSVRPGARILVTGAVLEEGHEGELPVTTLRAASFQLLGSAPLPEPIVLGRGGRRPPTELLDDDQLKIFDAMEDGIDFYEALEGMRVAIPDPLVVGPTSKHGDIAVVADHGLEATVATTRAGLLRRKGDGNPEILVAGSNTFEIPQLDVGDQLEGSLLGVIHYGHGVYRLQISPPLPPTPSPEPAMADSGNLEAGSSEAGSTKAGSTKAGDREKQGQGSESMSRRNQTLRKSVARQRLDQGSAIRQSPSLGPARRPRRAEPATTRLEAGPSSLTVATFNALNLAATDPEEKFARLAKVVVESIASPDLLALQEMQDEDGLEDSGVVSADATFSRLAKAIVDAGGPVYAWRQLDPENNADGGAPGANIRVGLMYRPNRVSMEDSRLQATVQDPFARVGGARTGPAWRPQPSLEEGRLRLRPSPTRLAHPAFDADEEANLGGTRKPLFVQARFQDKDLFVAVLHLASRRQDDPLMGSRQPPLLHSEKRRIEQARQVRTVVDQLLELDAKARVIVLGDLNDFPQSPTLKTLTGTDMENLVERVPEVERYTFNFRGSSQALDHILVSSSLAANAEVEIVHACSDFSALHAASDHDPVVARFRL